MMDTSASSIVIVTKCKDGAVCCSPSGQHLDILQIRGRQLAAFADNVVAEPLPLVEVAHVGTLDCGKYGRLRPSRRLPAV